MDDEIADRLSTLHGRLINQFSLYSENDLRTQYHPDLSQLGWHLAHIAFIEQYWLREVVLGDDSSTKDFHQYYFPELSARTERGGLLDIADFERLQYHFSDAEKLWTELSRIQYEHPLLKNDYLGWFLIQHAEQHYEIMHMVLHQRAINTVPETRYTAGQFNALDPALPALFIAEGEYEMGSDDVLACDNEQPVHVATLPAFLIAEKPVTNAEYLGFMQQDAYQRPEFWSDQGWQWKLQSRSIAPDHWRQDGRGNWYSLSLDGPTDIKANEAVFGLSWYEADAFARYAACRLPHEFEWEAAMKADSMLLKSTGQAWEWCANTFFPYTGFQAFPYERYSTPWFDNKHYMLKGAGPMTGNSVRQPSFRNFYNPDKRHIFAGLRLACGS